MRARWPSKVSQWREAGVLPGGEHDVAGSRGIVCQAAAVPLAEKTVGARCVKIVAVDVAWRVSEVGIAGDDRVMDFEREWRIVDRVLFREKTATIVGGIAGNRAASDCEIESRAAVRVQI